MKEDFGVRQISIPGACSRSNGMVLHGKGHLFLGQKFFISISPTFDAPIQNIAITLIF